MIAILCIIISILLLIIGWYQVTNKCDYCGIRLLESSDNDGCTNPECPSNVHEPVKVFLIDIDGTVSDDIKNEDSHLYATAKRLPNSREVINKWYDEGHIITFFTARVSKDRKVTEQWLNDHGFKYHGLVMDKPRIKDGQEYVWIDNRKVRAVTYLGTWSELTEVERKIKVFS
jgi:hypothetical protein